MAVSSAVCVLTSGLAHAQDATDITEGKTLKTVVVTATRSPEPLNQVMADVTVIDREAIERLGVTDMVSLLSRQPGIEIARSGGTGAVAGVFIRGAAPRFTLMLVDGVPVHTQSTQGGVPWESIALDNVERIEIVRGSGSAVYGTSAVAGVIQVFTRRGEGPLALRTGVTVGSRGLRKGDVHLSGSEGALNYAFSMTDENAKGTSTITRPDLYNFHPDRDGYGQQFMSGQLGWQINADHRLELLSSSNRNRVMFDDGLTAPDPVSVNTLRNMSVRWQANWGHGLRGLYLLGESNSGLVSTGEYPVSNQTRVRTTLVQHDWVSGEHAWQALVEQREDRLTDDTSRQRSLTGVGLAYTWNAQPVVLTTRVRHDRDSDQGNVTTGAVSASWAFADQWRLRGSLANAFRAPTLFERFYIYGGKPDLKPEKSVNTDLGLSWSSGDTSWDASIYRNRLTDMIVYGSSSYENKARAQLEGVSLSMQTTWNGVAWQGSVDVQNPRDLTTGNRLLRTARKSAKLAADGRLLGWNVGTQITVSGNREDVNYPSRVRLAGYAVADVFAQKRILPQWDALLRVNNVFNRAYESVYGYGQPGTAVMLTLRFNSQP